MLAIETHARTRPATAMARRRAVRMRAGRPAGILAALLGLTFMLAGCMEDTIQNTIESPGGAIYGRVLPAETGTEVAAWQAAKVKAVIVDAKGYFSLTELKAGLYDVVATAPSGAHRRIHAVEVDLTNSASLGNIFLSDLPSPLLGFAPGDGDVGVPLQPAFALMSEAGLDIASLSTAVQITPPIAGYWAPDYYPADAYRYILYSQQQLATGTEYRVHIGPGLELDTGEAWGSTLDYSFTTQGFDFVSPSWTRNGAEFPASFAGQIVSLQFNVPVDASTVAAAIHTVPPLDLVAVRSPYSASYVDVSVPSRLSIGARYELHIDDTLRDMSGTPLAAAQVLEFTTERLRVTSAEFYGQYGAPVEPGGDLYARIRLNAIVDAEAFNAAASFDPPIAGLWIRANSEEGVLDFFPDAPALQPGQAYAFRISGTAPLAGGATLGSDFASGFQVQPLRVRQMNPSNGARGVYTWTSIGLEFNAAMDQASVEAAFRLEGSGGAALPGTFYWSGDRSFSFSPLSQLASGTTHKISIAGTARSMSGAQLGAGVSSVFRTQ